MPAVLAALALAACDGSKNFTPPYGVAPESSVVDEDGDGYGARTDCDDSNPDIHPDAVETKDDGIDSNCDDADNT